MTCVKKKRKQFWLNRLESAIDELSELLEAPQAESLEGRTNQLLRKARNMLDDRDELQEQIRSLQYEAAQLRHENKRLSGEARDLRNSRSFRLGNFQVSLIKTPILKISEAIRNARSSVKREQATPEESPTHFVPPPNFADRKLNALSPPANLSQLRMLVVADEFTTEGLDSECEIYNVSPEFDVEDIDRFRPHMLFVESAWLGLEGRWQGKVSDAPSPELVRLVDVCRSMGIPTVFWNKEDPLHFLAFIETARLFDWVFTTDSDTIPSYVAALGHTRIGVMMFAVQMNIHNPFGQVIELDSLNETVSFAGSWYPHLAMRCRDFTSMFDAISSACNFRIYDRNARSDFRSTYPKRFLKHVVPAISYGETAILYRSSFAGVTLNTIKQSPTMFARRAIEVAACGTPVVSNFNLALRNLFGELMLVTDHSSRIFDFLVRHEAPASSARYYRKKLDAQLLERKIATQHTWASRLREMVSLLTDERDLNDEPVVNIVHQSEQSPGDFQRFVMLVASQVGVNVIAWSPWVTNDSKDVKQLSDSDLRKTPLDIFGDSYVAVLNDGDFYGQHYLSDLIRTLSEIPNMNGVGKTRCFMSVDGELLESSNGSEYESVASLPTRSSVFKASSVRCSVASLCRAEGSGQEIRSENLWSDGLGGYILNGARLKLPLDPGLAVPTDTGYDTADISRFLDDARKLIQDQQEHVIFDSKKLESLFREGSAVGKVSIEEKSGHVQLVARQSFGRHGKLISDTIPKTLMPEALYLDGPRQHACDWHVVEVNADHQAVARYPIYARRQLVLPEASVSTIGYKFEVVMRDTFVTYAKCIRSQGTTWPLILPGKERILIVVDRYPSTENLYANGFVHRRVLKYMELGVCVDVVCVTESESTYAYEYEGVVVHKCSADELRQTLKISEHRAIAVHFLNPLLWEAISDAAQRIPTTIWLHGSDVQMPSRRRFNYSTQEEYDSVLLQSRARISLWRDIFSEHRKYLKFVFVSQTFADETFADYGIDGGQINHRIINNPIDGNLFEFQEKPLGQRFKVLSIRPHASRVYANDLVGKAIELFSEDPIFSSFEFTLIGDGVLFDENFSKLIRFPNVNLRREFLSQSEIAQLHTDYGVFLCPSRSDTQGVSRDEAMSSGLVPITTSVGAIPELVSAEAGLVVEPESPESIAQALSYIGNNELAFRSMSRRSASSVRARAEALEVSIRELEVLGILPALHGDFVSTEALKLNLAVNG